MSKRITQRLFFALWPDHGVRLALGNLVADLPTHGGRVVHTEDLHVTLIFLGQVTVDQYPCVEQVARGIKAPSFRLGIDTCGYWKRPGILWCGSSETPGQLTELVSSLQQGLLSCGFKPEKREYAPHITLVRKARPTGHYSLNRPISWTPGEFVLATSDSGKRVPHYSVIKRWPLGS